MSEGYVENLVPTPELAPGELPVGNFNFIMNQPQSEESWVDVPEWKCKVKMRSLSKAEQTRLRNSSKGRNGQIDETKLEINLLVFSMVEPRLTFEEVDQLFTNGNVKALNRLSAAALMLSGLTEDYVAQAEESMKS